MSLGAQLVESEHLVEFGDDGTPVHSVRITLGRGELAALRAVAAAAMRGHNIPADVVGNAKRFEQWAGVVDRQLATRTGETL